MGIAPRSNLPRQSEAIMTEQVDFLKDAIAALTLSQDMAERAGNSEHYFDTYMRRSGEQSQRAMMLAIISLAQDVRRVADTLREIEGAMVDASGAYR